MEAMVDTVESLVVVKNRWNIDLQELLYYGQNIENVHVAVVARLALWKKLPKQYIMGN